MNWRVFSKESSYVTRTATDGGGQMIVSMDVAFVAAEADWRGGGGAGVTATSMSGGCCLSVAREGMTVWA